MKFFEMMHCCNPCSCVYCLWYCIQAEIFPWLLCNNYCDLGYAVSFDRGAVDLCEGYAGLKVIAVMSDKASSNQKLYRMQSMREALPIKQSMCLPKNKLVLFAFFSDPPHLIKTVRNNLQDMEKRG